MKKITIASAKDARKSRVTIEGELSYDIKSTGLYAPVIDKYKKNKEVYDIFVQINTSQTITVNGKICDLLNHPNNLLYGNAKEEPKYCSLSFTDDKGKRVIVRNVICCAIICWDHTYRGTYYQINATKRI